MGRVRCSGMAANDLSDGVDFVEPIGRQDYNAFTDYVRHVAVLMRLAEFDTRVSPQHCEAGYVAEVDTDFNYHKITIALCPYFHAFPAERKRTIIVHELYHAHATVMKMPYEGLSEIVSADAWTISTATGMRIEEHVVTSLELALAPHMPLPPSLKKSKRFRRK